MHAIDDLQRLMDTYFAPPSHALLKCDTCPVATVDRPESPSQDGDDCPVDGCSGRLHKTFVWA